VKKILGPCTSDSNVTFADVMKKIKTEDCIEEASRHLLSMLAYYKNQGLFDTCPFLSSDEKAELIKQHMKKNGAPIINTYGALNTNTLPAALVRPFYQ
jgi:hypothetical protein